MLLLTFNDVKVGSFSRLLRQRLYVGSSYSVALNVLILHVCRLPTIAFGESATSTIVQTGTFPPMTSQYLMDCRCWLFDNGGGHLSVKGSTQAYVPVESIYVRIYLDRLDGSTWVNIWTDSKTNTSSNYVETSSDVVVTPGRTYRVRAEHTVRQGTVVETGNSYTNSIVAAP